MSIDYTDKTLVAQIDKYNFTDKEHLTFLLHLHRKFLITIIVAIAVIGFPIMRFGSGYSFLTTILLLSLYLALLAVTLYLTLRWRVKKARPQPDGWTGSITVFEDGIRTNVNGGEGWAPWQMFIGYRTLPFGIALHYSPLLAFVLPKRLFQSEEDWLNTLKLVENQLAIRK